MSTLAAILAPWLGFFGGLIAWFVVTSRRSGEISVDSTGDATNAVAGNITSWGVGVLMAVVISYIAPKKWEFTDAVSVARINKINGIAPVDQSSNHDSGHVSEKGEAPDDIEKNAAATSASPEPASAPKPETIVKTGNEIVDFLETKHIEPMNPVEVRKATRLAVSFNIMFLVIAILLVPFTLFGTSWIFSRAGFTGFCVVSFIWVWVSMIICVIWPVIESWGTIVRIAKGIYGEKGRGKGESSS